MATAALQKIFAGVTDAQIEALGGRQGAPLVQDLSNGSFQAKQGRVLLNPLDLGASVVSAGDSYAAQSHHTASPVTGSVTSGVLNCSLAGHGLHSGQLITLTGIVNISPKLLQQQVCTVSSTSAFSIQVPGVADGAIVSLANVSIQLLDLKSYGNGGVTTYLSRRSLGGMRMVNNGGMPGYDLGQIAVEFQDRVISWNPTCIIFIGGYNDYARGYSVATIQAHYSAIFDLVGAIPFIFVPNGTWRSGATADSIANREYVREVYRWLRLECARRGYGFIDTMALVCDPATGYSKTGFTVADLIHPTTIWADRVAQSINTLYGRNFIAKQLVVDVLDTKNNNAANPNIARYGLSLGGSAGGLGTNVTATVPVGQSGTAGAPTGWAASGTSIPVGGGNAWTPAAPDGIGNACACRYTLTATGQQGRISYALTNSDLTLGGHLDVAFAFVLKTAHNVSAQTPSGQNITAITAQVVFMVDGNTYTAYDSQGSVATQAEQIDADVTYQVVRMDNVRIPTGASLTLARIDMIVNVSGAGSFDLWVWRLGCDSYAT